MSVTLYNPETFSSFTWNEKYMEIKNCGSDPSLGQHGNIGEK